MLRWPSWCCRRGRAALWFDELMLWSVPVVVMVAITFFTNINIGLRYVLPIFPFVMISAGKVAPWVAGIEAAGEPTGRAGPPWGSA